MFSRQISMTNLLTLDIAPFKSCQKTYNGVSILSKYKDMIDINPVRMINKDEMRSISATYDGIRVINFYVVNGQSIGSDKYIHKMKWLKKHANIFGNNLRPTISL